MRNDPSVVRGQPEAFGGGPHEWCHAPQPVEGSYMVDRNDPDRLEPESSRELTPTERFARALSRRDRAPAAVPGPDARSQRAERRVAQTSKDDEVYQPRSRCPVCNVMMICVGETAAALLYRCERCRAGLSVPRPSHA